MRQAVAVALSAGLVGGAVVPGATAGAAPPPPTTVAERCFADRTFRVFAGRPATDAEISSWAGRFAAGTDRSVLVRDLATSDLWLGATVDRLYERALDRAPDGAGRRFWIARLRAGGSVNEFGTLVYGSPEFLRRAGGTTADFVADLYTRVLGRPADGAGLRSWSRVVEQRGRGPVAAAFFASSESRRDRVRDLYQRLLGRSPDGAGLASWTTALLTVNDVRLATTLASSAEFRRRADGCALPGTFELVSSSSGASWSGGLSADGKVAAFIGWHPGGSTHASEQSAYVVDRAAGTEARLGDPACNPFAAAISRNGRWVAYVESDPIDLGHPGPCNAERSSALDRQSGTTIVRSGWGRVMAVSDSGDVALVLNGLSVWNWGSGEVVDLIPYDGAAVPQSAAFSADGTSLAAVLSTVREGTVVSVDLASGGVRTVAPVGPLTSSSHSHGVATTAGGEQIFFFSDVASLVPGDTNRSADLFRWDRDTGEIFAISDVTVARTVDDPQVVVTPDGSFAAYGFHRNALPGDDTSIYRWERSTGVSIDLTPGVVDTAFPAGISDDGRTVFFHSTADDLAPGATHVISHPYLWLES